MKRLSILLCLGQAIGAMCALGAEFVSVAAENFESCRELKPGKIYRFAESVDFAAALGENAMSLTSGTAGLVVPAGVKVTLAGGAADGVLGGGAVTSWGERKNTRKAFATPWEVCFNVAYPTRNCKNTHLKQAEGQRMQSASPLPFRVIQKGISEQ